jgi:hypothetical protein
MSTKEEPAIVPGFCAPCAQLNAGASAFCATHKRAFLGPDCDDPKVADLIRELCKRHGVTLGQPSASIAVDVAEVGGVRVVQIAIPTTGQIITLNLDPDTAIQLAACIMQGARDAKSPAGLILPG